MSEVIITDDPRKVSDSLAVCLDSWVWLTEHRCNLWWVALEGKAWLAYGGLSIFNRETLYLGPDHVLREYRGRGLQRLLISKREDWGKQEGYQAIVCIVAHDNIYSANNFMRSGYVLRKPWPGTDPKNNYLYFQKDLTK